MSKKPEAKVIDLTKPQRPIHPMVRRSDTKADPEAQDLAKLTNPATTDAEIEEIISRQAERNMKARGLVVDKRGAKGGHS